MNQIKINIPISFGEENSLFSFENNVIELTFNLEDGKHIYRSTQIKIGNYHGLDIFLLLEIPYSYNTETKEFIFSDKNYRYEDLIKFHISSGDNNLISSVFTYNEYTTNVSPLFSLEHNSFLKLRFDEIIDKISPVIISALFEAGVRNVFKPSFALEITKENFNNLKGILDDTMSESPENIFKLQHFITSTYLGVEYFAADTAFANVIGSAGDKKVDGLAWLELWRQKTQLDDKSNPSTLTCTSLNHFFDPHTNQEENKLCTLEDRNGNSTLVGGHVIKGKFAYQVAHDSQANLVVWLLPICTTHNSDDYNYMKTLNDINVNSKKVVAAVKLNYWA